MTGARETFASMASADRCNLAALARWLDPRRERQDWERLVGPEYARLRMHGVIDNPMVSTAAGRPVVLTDLGRDVLRCIEGGL